MVAAVRPTATVQAADVAESGYSSVYHLAVETQSGTREWVLKASPDEGQHGIGTESRLLPMLADHTSIPVPAVIGAVDIHDSLPTPFFVMERLTGVTVPKQEVGALSNPVLARLSRQTGNYLAELHLVDGPEGYGRVDIDPSRSLTGDRPTVDPTQLSITELQGISSSDRTDWPVVLKHWAQDTLERLESTRFHDLTDDVRRRLLEMIDSMEGPFCSVLGRVDHGLHNVLIDPDSGAITGVIDWAFTLSVPAAYDLVCVEANLARDPWSVHPSTPDPQRLIRTKLFEGYLEVGNAAVVERSRDHHAVY